MGTRSVQVGREWVLLGSTPIEVETNSTFDLFITVASQMPETIEYPAQRMIGAVAPVRVFDMPNMNVYARSVGGGNSIVVVVPRASISALSNMIASAMQNTLTIDPDSGDVFDNKVNDNGSG